RRCSPARLLGRHQHTFWLKKCTAGSVGARERGHNVGPTLSKNRARPRRSWRFPSAIAVTLGDCNATSSVFAASEPAGPPPAPMSPKRSRANAHAPRHWVSTACGDRVEDPLPPPSRCQGGVTLGDGAFRERACSMAVLVTRYVFEDAQSAHLQRRRRGVVDACARA